MNRILRTTLIVLSILVLAGALVFAGVMIGNRYVRGYFRPGYGMMNNYREAHGGAVPIRGMMGRGNGYGLGMMSGTGMMRGSTLPGYSANVKPLSIDQVYQAAGKYVIALSNPDLKIAEVMVFDNNAYVRVIEKSTSIGAFELLVDPATQTVYPEYGPNMMWNLKYASQDHQNMMGGRGGMMGNPTFNSTPSAISATIPVTSAQALQTAQQYLDTAQPGTKTATDADPFYGYYTIDILRDGKIVGMLSVNGYSSQVFMHTWHGTFIATQDY